MPYPVRQVLNSAAAARLFAGLISLAGLSAQALPLTATEVLRHFNVVTLGDFAMASDSTSHVEGLTFVGVWKSKWKCFTRCMSPTLPVNLSFPKNKRSWSE